VPSDDDDGGNDDLNDNQDDDADDDTDDDDEPTWTDPDTGLMWLNPGLAGVGRLWNQTWEGAKQACNNLTYAGYNDWWLPTISELRTLVRGCPDTETGGNCEITDECGNDCGSLWCRTCDESDAPFVGCFWPHGIANLDIELSLSTCDAHWSSTPVYGDYSLAYYLNFRDASVDYISKTREYATRCVRNADSDDDLDDDSDDDSDDDGPWTDPSSGLTWQNPHDELLLPQNGAHDYCWSLSLLGQDDWRLPTISELRSLIRGCDQTELDGSCGVTDACLSLSDCWSYSCDGCYYLSGPGSGGAYWPDSISGNIDWHWSISPNPDGIFVGLGWIINFTDGSVHSNRDDNGSYVRCVRP